MPAEAAAGPLAIHATAVAIDDMALLIRGAARAGKSRLALALIARTTPKLPIRLIGDDRILLHPVADGLGARPHPRIVGFIERRGLGIVAMPWVGEARVGGIVDLPDSRASQVLLGTSAQSRACGFSLGAPGIGTRWDTGVPTLVLAHTDEIERVERVLVWWAGLTAT